MVMKMVSHTEATTLRLLKMLLLMLVPKNDGGDVMMMIIVMVMMMMTMSKKKRSIVLEMQHSIRFKVTFPCFFICSPPPSTFIMVGEFVWLESLYSAIHNNGSYFDFRLCYC